MESESDFFSNSQPFPIKIINDRPHIKSFEFGTSLRPEQNIETQVGQETSDDEWVDILNHACFKDKLLCVGHKYQAEVTSLGLYDNSMLNVLMGFLLASRTKERYQETMESE